MFAVVLLPVMSMMIILGVLIGGARSTASCPASASATGPAASAAQSAATARFLTRTASDQALSPSSAATSDTSGVC